MQRLTVRLAMLCMAFLLLSACGASSQAAPRQASQGQAQSASIAVQAPAATSLPTATPAATVTPASTATTLRTAANSPAQASTPATTLATAGQLAVTFAVVGDNGTHGSEEKQVAAMVEGWKPDFIVDVGDAYYKAAGGTATGKYDRSIGAFYCDFLKDVTTSGANCPHGNADRNRLFATLGNHDYTDGGLDNYLSYFDLPGSSFNNTSGNERYYDFTWGPIHFFSLDSNDQEPDGVTPDSKQGQWLKAQLAKSTSPWNVVFFHHPPYSSGARHGSTTRMQWPFKAWGAQVVLSGHEHLYERLQVDGVTYFVNGGGGSPLYEFKPQPVAGSQVRIAGSWGAQKVTATDTKLTFDYYTLDGKLADSYTLEK